MIKDVSCQQCIHHYLSYLNSGLSQLNLVSHVDLTQTSGSVLHPGTERAMVSVGSTGEGTDEQIK